MHDYERIARVIWGDARKKAIVAWETSPTAPA